MKYKLGWISWVTICLYIASMAFLIYCQNAGISILKGYNDYIFTLITVAPLVLFGIFVLISIFKRINADKKNYWYIDDICLGTIATFFTFLVISAILLIILINNPKNLELKNWIEKLLFLVNFSPLLVISMRMFGKILFNTKRKIRILLWDILFLFFFGFMFSAMFYLDTVHRLLFFIFFINGLAIILTLIFNLFLNNKILEIPFKILVCGFIGGSILLLINCLYNINSPYDIYALTLLSTVIIAADVNISSNPKENQSKIENKWRQDEK